MNKKLIRLTESDLHRIVKESVNRVLTETQEWFSAGNKHHQKAFFKIQQIINTIPSKRPFFFDGNNDIQEYDEYRYVCRAKIMVMVSYGKEADDNMLSRCEDFFENELDNLGIKHDFYFKGWEKNDESEDNPLDVISKEILLFFDLRNLDSVYNKALIDYSKRHFG